MSHCLSTPWTVPVIWFALIVIVLFVVIKLHTTHRIRAAVFEHEMALKYAAQLSIDAAYFCRLFTGGHWAKIDEHFPDYADFARDQRAYRDQEYVR